MIVSACFGLILASLVQVNNSPGLQILPPRPTSCDEVVVVVERFFTEDCNWRFDSKFSIDDDGSINVLIGVHGEDACADVEVVRVVEISLGALTPGDHIVAVTWTDPDGRPEKGIIFVSESGDCDESGFRRGDSNGDGEYDIADPISALGHMFLGNTIPCASAADADDSGELDISDAIRVLGHLFLGSEPPPPPFEQCGPDPTPDTFISCEKPHCPGGPVDPGPVWLAMPDGCVQCVRCNAPPLEDLVARLEESGIEVLDSGIGAVPVCLACEVCSSGRFFMVQVPAAHVSRARRFGFTPSEGLQILR